MPLHNVLGRVQRLSSILQRLKSRKGHPATVDLLKALRIPP